MSNNQRKYTAYFLMFMLMVSTIGISVHARWCACNQQTYLSLFVDNTDECCEHHENDVLPTLASCCAHASEETSCSIEAIDHQYCSAELDKGCCSTDSDFLVLDEDFSPTVIEQLKSCKCCLLHDLPRLYTLISLPQRPSFLSPLVEQLKNAIPDRAPPLLYGRELLNFVQVYRC